MVGVTGKPYVFTGCCSVARLSAAPVD